MNLEAKANFRRQPIRIGEAARRIGVTPRALRRFLQNGGLPTRRLPGSQYFIDPDEVDRLVERLSMESTGSAWPKSRISA